MTPPLQNNRRGLTATELLVVAAIVGVLAALIFPSVRGMMERAKGVNCASGLRQFGTALLAYRGEHNGFLPPGKLIPPLTPDNENPQTGIDIAKDLRNGGYLTTLPYCPSSRLTEKGLKYISDKNISEKTHFQNKGSYALNIFLTQTKIEGLPGPYWGGHPYPGESKMLFVAETYYAGLIWALSHLDSALNGFDTGQIFIAPRHHGSLRLHFMFLDGHIAALAPKVTATDSTGNGTYDWSEHFDSAGRNGRYINMRRARSSE